MDQIETPSTDEELLSSLDEDSGRAEAFLATLVNESPDEAAVSVVEPFTWSWVGITLAEGAIAWVGGQLFSKIFGSGGGKLDIGRFLQDVLKTMGQVVHRTLEERDLRVLGAQLQQVQFDLVAYLDAPRGRDRLNFATNNSSSVMFQLRDLHLSGHAAFLVAVGVHIAVLQERVRAIDRRDRLAIARVLRDEAIPHAEEMNRQWRSWHERRYRSKHIDVRIDMPGRSRGIRANFWIVFRDSKEIGRARHEPQAVEYLTKDRERVWSEIIYPRYVQPSETILAKWRELLETIRP